MARVQTRPSLLFRRRVFVYHVVVRHALERHVLSNQETNEGLKRLGLLTYLDIMSMKKRFSYLDFGSANRQHRSQGFSLEGKSPGNEVG